MACRAVLGSQEPFRQQSFTQEKRNKAGTVPWNREQAAELTGSVSSFIVLTSEPELLTVTKSDPSVLYVLAYPILGCVHGVSWGQNSHSTHLTCGSSWTRQLSLCAPLVVPWALLFWGLVWLVQRLSPHMPASDFRRERCSSSVLVTVHYSKISQLNSLGDGVAPFTDLKQKKGEGGLGRMWDFFKTK